MGFRLVPNSVTLDDLERRNSPNGRVIFILNVLIYGLLRFDQIQYVGERVKWS